MKRPITALAVLALAACATEAPPASEAIAIVGAQLIDGSEAPPIDDSAVVVADGRIVAAGPRAEVEIPPGAEIVDAAGQTLVPGLIDLHCHYAPDSAETKRLLAAQLAFGVTTVRSIGTDTAQTMAAMAEVEAGAAPGPRIYTAGLGFTHPEGHPIALPYLRRPSSPEEAREGVRELAEQQVDFLKIWVESKYGSLPKISREVREAIVDEAARHGIPVVAHVFDREDFDHLLGLGVADFLHSVRDQEPMDQAFIDAVQDKDVSFTATLTVIESNWLLPENPELLDGDPELRAALGAKNVGDLGDAEWRRERLASARLDILKPELDRAKRFFSQMYGEGMTILAGSDSGAGLIAPGWGTHNELRLLAESGIAADDALRMATGRAAQRVGAEDVGVLRPGAVADLLILDKDPLADIRNTRSIARIMQSGEWVDRRALLGI